MPLKLQMLNKIMSMILQTKPVEIGCDDCFAHLDVFSEMMLAGKPAAETLPLVQDHLERCPNCQEEFEALMASLKANI